MKARAVLLGLLFLAGNTEAAPPRGWLDPLAYRDALAAPLARAKRLEFTEMLSAIMTGSRMGPGGGWFHPSQSRYSFKWLAGQFDRNGDGKIAPGEMKKFLALFSRLDRDRDGIISPGDFDWSDSAPFLRDMGLVRMWTARIDTSSNGRISKQEWDEFFERAAKGKNHLTPDDLREALMQQRRSGPPPAGPAPDVMLAGLFNGELGSAFEGPELGARAPAFTLKTHDGKRTIRLADSRGKKPVVLIFGSFT